MGRQKCAVLAGSMRGPLLPQLMLSSTNGHLLKVFQFQGILPRPRVDSQTMVRAGRKACPIEEEGRSEKPASVQAVTLHFQCIFL